MMSVIGPPGAAGLRRRVEHRAPRGSTVAAGGPQLRGAAAGAARRADRGADPLRVPAHAVVHRSLRRDRRVPARGIRVHARDLGDDRGVWSPRSPCIACCSSVAASGAGLRGAPVGGHRAREPGRHDAGRNVAGTRRRGRSHCGRGRHRRTRRRLRRPLGRCPVAGATPAALRSPWSNRPWSRPEI